MKVLTVPQIVAVSENTAEAFEEKYNAKIRELVNHKITDTKIDISAGVFSAVISYETTERYMDSVADEFHAEGIRYLCKNCPYLEDPKDKRIKYCKCKYAEFGSTHKDHEACELFYKELKVGKIDPIPDCYR